MVVADPICNAGRQDIIHRDRVEWAINSFKSSGPDGIFPALPQYGGDLLYEYLVDVYKDCLRWYNIPDGWNVLVFIPKASKSITLVQRIIDRCRSYPFF